MSMKATWISHRLAGPVVAGTSAALLVGLLLSSPAEAGPRGQADADGENVAASPWPELDGRSDAGPPLQVTTNRPRGALRLTGVPQDGAPQADAMTMHVLPMANGSRKDVAVFEAGYGVGDTLEFYGIEAGRRQVFFRRGAQSSGLVTVEVPETGIGNLPLPEFAKTETRTLKIVADGQAVDSATVLVRYQEFDLLHHWSGQPIELRSPLAHPDSIAVSVAKAESTERKRFGGSMPVAKSTDDIEFSLASVENALVMATGGSLFAKTPENYCIEITAQPGAASQGAQPFTHVLSALRADEFGDVPREHTWLAGPPDRELAIDGVAEEDHWVGVGVQGRARYVLWRNQERDVREVWRREPAAHSSEIPKNGLVVPSWIRTVTLTERLAPGSRKHHKAGPSQVWETVPTNTGYKKRLAAWVDGQGQRRNLPIAAVAVPWPDTMQATDLVSIVVRTPHPVRGDGIRFEFEGRGSEPMETMDVPDGLLDVVIARRGRMLHQLRGVVKDGRLLEGARWRDAGDPGTPDTRKLAVIDDERQPVANADLYDEVSNELAKTAANGRADLELGSFRSPAFVSVRTEQPGFTHNDYVTAAQQHVQLPRRSGSMLTWTNMQAMLGVDLGTLQIENLFLARQPGGETAQLNPQRRALLQPDEIVEFTGSAPSSEIWGWLDKRALSIGLGPIAPGALGFADVVIVNRSIERVVHLTLPRSEIRLGVGAGRLRRVRLVAPVELGLLAMGAADDSKTSFAIGEGIRADLLPNDVLVVTYDDVR